MSVMGSNPGEVKIPAVNQRHTLSVTININTVLQNTLPVVNNQSVCLCVSISLL